MDRIETYHDILDECRNTLKRLKQEAYAPKFESEQIGEIEKYWDARALSEQAGTFVRISMDKNISVAHKYEMLLPVFEKMTALVREANQNVPAVLKREQNEYGRMLQRLYIIATSTRSRSENEGIDPSGPFGKTLSSFQLAVEEAYEELVEESALFLSEEERSEIESLMAELQSNAIGFDRAVAVCRTLWNHKKRNIADRIDSVAKLIDIVMERLR